MGSLLQKSLPVSTLVVAIDPGKAQNRVWLTRDDPELVVEPFTLPVLRAAAYQLPAGEEYPTSFRPEHSSYSLSAQGTEAIGPGGAAYIDLRFTGEANSSPLNVTVQAPSNAEGQMTLVTWGSSLHSHCQRSQDVVVPKGGVMEISTTANLSGCNMAPLIITNDHASDTTTTSRPLFAWTASGVQGIIYTTKRQ